MSVGWCPVGLCRGWGQVGRARCPGTELDPQPSSPACCVGQTQDAGGESAGGLASLHLWAESLAQHPWHHWQLVGTRPLRAASLCGWVGTGGAGQGLRSLKAAPATARPRGLYWGELGSPARPQGQSLLRCPQPHEAHLDALGREHVSRLTRMMRSLSVAPAVVGGNPRRLGAWECPTGPGTPTCPG